MRLAKLLVIGSLTVAAPAFGQVTVGVKNFQQLLSSYAAITGVSPTDAEISAYFDQSKTRLPKFGRVDEVSSPMLLTASALGGLFCKKMIASDAERAPTLRRAHKLVDFTKAPADALTDAVQRSVVGEYARLFWRRGASDTETTLLLQLTEAAVTAGGTTPEDTLTALRPVCASVAGSLATLVN